MAEFEECDFDGCRVTTDDNSGYCTLHRRFALPTVAAVATSSYAENSRKEPMIEEHPIKASDIGAEENSQAIIEARADYDLAKQALDKADCKQLFRLYEKVVKQQGETIETMLRVIDLYRKDKPMASASPDALKSMTEVALAAIDLAKSLSTPK